MVRHPVVIFFPSEYKQDADGGSYLRLFGTSTASKIAPPLTRYQPRLLRQHPTMTAASIQELFEKPVDRPIDGVIKADDEPPLQIELDEYIVTRELAKGLNVFTEA